MTSILRLAGSRRGPSAASSECAPQRRFIALSLIGNLQMSTRYLHFALSRFLVSRFLVSRFLSQKGLAVAYDAGRCSSYGTDRAGRRAGGNPGGWFSALRVCPKLDPAELWLLGGRRRFDRFDRRSDCKQNVGTSQQQCSVEAGDWWTGEAPAALNTGGARHILIGEYAIA